jgi:hypothetical protein
VTHLFELEKFFCNNFVNAQFCLSMKFTVTLITRRVLHGSAPRHLGTFVPNADCQFLQSAPIDHLKPTFDFPQPAAEHFPVAGSHIWNYLSDEVTAAFAVSFSSAVENFPASCFIP